MKTVLWLDDLRNPKDNIWTKFIENSFNVLTNIYDIIWAKSFDDFKAYIDRFGLPDYVCFDHDLGEVGETERNGMTCATYIVDYCIDHDIDIPDFAIQSSNPVGAANISGIMNGWHKMFVKTH